MEKQIIEAIALLRKEGYFVKKIYDDAEEAMNECAESNNVDCCGCSANICMLND